MIKPRKNLILGTVGDNSLHSHWINENSSYDIGLIYFGDKEGYEGQTKYYHRAKGFKFHLLQDYINANPWVLNYDYIWLPDDDIHATPSEIENLFGIMKDYDLWLAQPSIIGYYGVKITLHQQGSLIRFTNWVEIMCPCFCSKALNVCKEVFKENKRGWSIESIWNVLLGHPQDKIAIIDDVAVAHTRPVGKGSDYSLDEATKEAIEVYYKWGLDDEMEKDIKHGTLTGGEIYSSVVYKQFFKELEDHIEKSARFWPPSSLIKNAIDQGIKANL
jgi:hypothetical protein